MCLLLGHVVAIISRWLVFKHGIAPRNRAIHDNDTRPIPPLLKGLVFVIVWDRPLPGCAIDQFNALKESDILCAAEGMDVAGVLCRKAAACVHPNLQRP